ncbi:MAG TPA: hypothetical protein VFH06_03750 [Candidatus Saccharimonadales bacterium]|nr:hypothetical protein [Candidatus Saccharimonadales bacterium]
MPEIIRTNPYGNEAIHALEKKRRETIGDYSYDRFAKAERQQMNVQDEVSAYIDTWDSDQLQNIELLHSDMDMEPLSRAVSAYVIIPVAAAQETHLFRRTLEQYATQDTDPSTWSLMLYLNHVAPTTPEEDRNIRAIQRVIDEFKTAHPALSVRVAHKTYEDQAPPIGGIRGEAWDLALYDIMKSDIDNDDLIGITHDADAAFISPNYISEMQKAAVSVPLADIFTGYLHWHKDGDTNSDANRVLAYWTYTSNLRRQTQDVSFVHTGPDSNAGIRIATYAAMRGYNKLAKMAEIHELQERIAIARRLPYKDLSHFHYIETIRLSTDSRRLYETLARGFPPDYAWTSLPFSTGRDPIRNADNHVLANIPIPPQKMLEYLVAIDNLHLLKLEDREWFRRVGRTALRLPLEGMFLPTQNRP